MESDGASSEIMTITQRQMEKKDLKIVFFGTPEFAVASLDKLVTAGYNIVCAVTMPDKPAGRGHKMYHSPVKEYAVAHDIPLLQPVRLKDDAFVEELRSFGADLFIVIAFRMLRDIQPPCLTAATLPWRRSDKLGCDKRRYRNRRNHIFLKARN